MAWEPTALMEALEDSVAVFSRDACFVYANRATERMFARPREELIGKRVWELFPEAVDGEFHQAFKRVQALGVAEVADAYYPPFDRWYRNHFYVIDNLIHVITRDITEHKLGERRLVALARASALFTRALEVDQMFNEIAKSLAELVGDACLVRVLDGGMLKLVALHHPDAQRRQVLGEFFANPLDATEGLSAKVLATGEPLLIERIDSETLRTSFQAEGQRDRIVRGGARSAIAVALSEGVQRLGVITMLRDVNSRPYSRGDLSLLQDLTERASLALTRARLFEETRLERQRAVIVANASRAFSAAERDTSAILDLLARTAVAQVGEVAVASLISEDGLEVQPVAYHANSALSAEIQTLLGTRTALAGSMSERVVKTGKALRIASIDVTAFASSTAARFQPMVEKFQPKSFVMVPIKRGERVIGTLSASRQFGDAYNDADQHLLQELADRAGLAIENARMLDAERSARQHAERVAEQTHRLQTIGSHLSHRRSARDIAETILRESTAVLGPTTGAIWLLDETGTRLEMLADAGYSEAQRSRFTVLPLAADIPLCAAVTSAAPVYISSIREYTERFPTSAKRLGADTPVEFATACLPLVTEGRAIGGLAFAYPHTHEFLADERAFLGVLASQCAQAIDRSRLLDQERAASAALAETNRTLNAVIQASPAAIVIADLDGIIRLWNPAAERMFGWTADETIGQLWPRIEGFRDELSTTLARLAAGESITGVETKRRRRDGTTLELALWAAPVPRPDGATQALKVFLDITDRKRAEDHARAADRKKDEFLAMLGHELRNPLAPILTALELMRFRGETAGQRERDMIERQTRHLVRLVDDLLDISRITRGKIELRKARTDVGAVIAQAVEMASPLLEQRGHHVSIAAPRGSLFVDGDSFRLAQVFQNLLTNAAKYTPGGGSISVRAQIAGDQIECEIEDNGEGISPEAIAMIFEPFVQGTRKLDRSQGGLGLGLTLVRSLTELHGGTVEANSAGPGQGSRFVVRLPRAIDATRADKLASDRIPALQKPRRILLVDDNRDAAEMLADLLREAGHEVVVAYDGPGALGAIPQFQPDVALLDIGLPLMDGYDLARRLKDALPATPRLVAISGYGQDHDRRRSAEAGFDAHLVKPVQAAQVLAAVDAKTRSS